MWSTRKFLIWGKTYPEFSKKYLETVCTGAVDEETGKLARIYPLTVRYMEKPFRTYDWVEVEAEPTGSNDRRPESFRVQQQSLKVVGHIDTTKKNDWPDRRRWVLGPKNQNVFASVEELRAAQAKDRTSLGLIRPKAITRVYAKRKPESARAEWDEKRAAALSKSELFIDAETETRDLEYVPVQYRACFRCDDPACDTEHDLSILDWGLYVLHLRQFAARGASMAERDVIDHIQNLLDPKQRDPFLFLGNTLAHPQNFMIVGLFHPPIERQGSLF
ncbi:MAG TPA: hypothetical protein VHB21_11380 [Minicystis sp.]|nr:hypothetical protein [Minicystis sp.]